VFYVFKNMRYIGLGYSKHGKEEVMFTQILWEKYMERQDLEAYDIGGMILLKWKYVVKNMRLL
jgi:hypothetical protein